jgi:Fatty acid hydroxylase
VALPAINPDPAEIKAAALRRGRKTKRWNAAAAILSGVVPALILSYFFPVRPQRWLAGFLLGLIWANGFEYFYHRFLLHLPKNFLARGHLRHHSSVGTPYEAEHVNLGSSPLWVVVLFVINGGIVVPLDLLLRLGIAGGMLLGFVAYEILVEEFHWRIHLGGWLPPQLRWCRDYHLAHHDRPDGRFNIFLPLFDFIFSATAWVKHPRLFVGSADSTLTSLTLVEKSLLVWLFTLAVAANIFQGAPPPKSAATQQTQRVE